MNVETCSSSWRDIIIIIFKYFFKTSESQSINPSAGDKKDNFDIRRSRPWKFRTVHEIFEVCEDLQLMPSIHYVM